MANRPKLAVYWAASCGGCEIALVNLHERLLELDARFELCFCPCLLDIKKHDVEAMADASIAITLFNGAVRTGENVEMARLLRRKSQVLVAYGACAKGGGIPALSNFSTPLKHFAASYLEGPTSDNPGFDYPQPESSVPEGTLALPEFFRRVQTLADTVEVDYFLPGCPPEPERLWEALTLLSGPAPPPRGSVVGAGATTVCEECARIKSEKRLDRFRRVTEFIPDPTTCLLEQGLICLGIATRGGCGGLCPVVNIPCSGCYGAPEGVADQGLAMLSALGSILDPTELKELSEADAARRIETAAASVLDCAGSFYLYSLAESLLKGAARS
jgi:F420-non-reducing hydrogenase small subunit